MASRKTRRTVQDREIKVKPNAKKQLIIMLISIVLMIFSVTQVYYLARYTFGFEVSQEKLSVYKWFCMLLDNDTNAALE